MKYLLPILAFVCSSISYSQEAERLTWPRAIEKGKHTITLYQPQPETLDGNILKGRMALSIKDNQDKMTFGALWFTVRLETDLESRTASLESIGISKVKFPDIQNEKNIEKLKEVIITDIESTEIVMSLDKIISSLESVNMEQQLEDQLNNKAPQIYFRKVPTVLVVIDGEPKLKAVENSKMEYVVNTPFFIVKNKDTYYLKGAKNWYESNAIVANTWQETTSIPKDVSALAEQKFDKDTAEGTEDDQGATPGIIVVTEPSELIITNGEMAYEPVKGTSLLYVTNTENDILLDINTQDHYLLLNGRWYGSKTMKDLEWTFVEPDDLPKEFVAIPADDENISAIRASVPGTQESQEAVYEQYMPQTAVVDKKTATTEVTYDGEPKFEKIEGSTMTHAVNTQSTVLAVDNMYYVVDDGVWFQSASAKGPWQVAESRPEEVDSLPPSSPVYNVKYVYIYDSTPDVVYVGYTPGYYHSYMYGGVVVYGTGYYYQPWYGYYYYPRPVTYGFGVHYNPYTGWGFSVGVSYGWMTVSVHSHGYWGPGGYAHGYRHGYHHGYHRGYHDGYAAGYARGKYDSRNAYHRTGEGEQRTGVKTRRETRTDGRSNINTQNRRENITTNRNDLFADRDGNVHQRDQNGNWQQKRNSQTEQRQRERQPKESVQRQRPSNETGQRQRAQLERDYSKRSRGSSNYQRYNNNRTRTPARSGTRSGIPRRRG